VRLDAATGVGTLVNPNVLIPFANVDGLTHAAYAGALIASVDNNNPAAPVRSLITINPVSGQWSTACSLGIGRVYGLAYDPVSTFIGGTTGSQFYVLQANGQGTPIGALGATDIEGLAYDPDAQILYGTSVGNSSNPVGRLFVVNRENGQGTPIGPLIDAQGNAYTSVAGLAYDRNSHTLYGSDTLRDRLIRIERTTARVTPVGLLGFAEVAGLAFHPGAGILYGVDNATDRLLRINTATGQGTAIGALGFADVEGLDFDAANGILYGTDATALQMIRINTTTGLGALVGTTAYKVDGLAGRIQ
jgi:DNA-binding beta-propeller fold protein YncE